MRSQLLIVHAAVHGKKQLLSPPFQGVAAKCLVALALLALAATVFWKLRYIPRKQRADLLTSDDSFANQMMSRASKISWISTLFLLFLIGSIINKDSTALPASFYMDLTAFFMLITFSVSFLWLFRTLDEGEQQNAGL